MANTARTGPPETVGWLRGAPGCPASIEETNVDPEGTADRVTVLDEILDGVRADLAERQQRVSLDQLKEMAGRAPSPRDGVATLKADGVSVLGQGIGGG